MLKTYVCVEVDHHQKIAQEIKDFQKDGWNLHTYQAATKDLGIVSHYLLFEKQV